MAGTTIEDDGQVPAAFASALAAEGIEVSSEELQGVRGAAKREAIGRLLARRLGRPALEIAERVEHVYARFRELLRLRFNTQGVRFLPGVLETFEWLHARGIRIVLNTGFDGGITQALLNAAVWDARLAAAVICGDDVPQGRPAPYMLFRAMERTGIVSVHRVMAVGDTTLDLEAGFNAGVRFNIGVLSGAHSADRLARAPHTHLLPSVADLPGLWQSG
jgi:phosphonatase-like hydrolase